MDAKSKFLLDFANMRSLPSLDFCFDIVDELKKRQIDHLFIIFKPELELKKTVNVQILVDLSKENRNKYLEKAIHIAAKNIKVCKSPNNLFNSEELNQSFKAIQSQGISFILILFLRDKVKNIYFLENDFSVDTARRLLLKFITEYGEYEV